MDWPYKQQQIIKIINIGKGRNWVENKNLLALAIYTRNHLVIRAMVPLHQEVVLAAKFEALSKDFSGHFLLHQCFTPRSHAWLWQTHASAGRFTGISPYQSFIYVFWTKPREIWRTIRDYIMHALTLYRNSEDPNLKGKCCNMCSLLHYSWHGLWKSGLRRWGHIRPCNYRGLTITSSLRKLCNMVLNNRLNSFNY